MISSFCLQLIFTAEVCHDANRPQQNGEGHEVREERVQGKAENPTADFQAERLSFP